MTDKALTEALMRMVTHSVKLTLLCLAEALNLDVEAGLVSEEYAKGLAEDVGLRIREVITKEFECGLIIAEASEEKKLH